MPSLNNAPELHPSQTNTASSNNLLLGAGALATAILVGLGIKKYFFSSKEGQKPAPSETDNSTRQPKQENKETDSTEDTSSNTDSDEETSQEVDQTTQTQEDDTSKVPTLKRLNKIPANKDFSKHYKELSRIDFSGQDLSKANFKGVLLTECKFDDANLDQANFENAEVDFCSFKDTKKEDILFPKGVNTSKARFYHCAMKATQGSGGNASGAKIYYDRRRKDVLKT